MTKDKQPIYPLDKWVIREEVFSLETNYRNETTFALSNGYIGSRGTMEEAYPFDADTGMEGNFINGFYESTDIRYGEANFGSPMKSQTLLNLPNLKETRITVDGETFSLLESQFSQYHRSLYLKEGLVRRSLVWRTKSGKELKIESLRLVSFHLKHCMVQQLVLTPLNFQGTVTISSRLNGDVENQTRKTNPIVDYGPFGRRLEPQLVRAKDNLQLYRGTTIGSQLSMACGSLLEVFPKDALVSIATSSTNLAAETIFELYLIEGKPIFVDKFMAYCSCLDGEALPLEECIQNQLEEAVNLGVQTLVAYQQSYMDDFWNRAAVDIQGTDADAIIQGVNFNLFHIFQGAGRDGRCGMPAKALTGEGYEGHYFWDTEMYMIPLFIYTQPEVARALLTWRFNTLEQARSRARIMGHLVGALFPWRTINGQEASTYYPLGSAQYHINGDVSYAVSLYYQVTGDKDLCETWVLKS